MNKKVLIITYYWPPAGGPGVQRWLKLSNYLLENNVKPIIYIKDDSSSDSSLEIIRKLSFEHENINILESGNEQINASTAFYEMIVNIPVKTYDYFAFCDQDDIWNYNKLTRAVKCLKLDNIHGYSSNVVAFWPTNKKKKIIRSVKDIPKTDFLIP